jgi:hypothetical protein
VGLGLGVALTLAVAHAHDPISTRVTWHGDVARIVGARCVGCHSPDGRGPMSLATYEDARPWAKAIKEEVMTRRMPKWHAVRGYGDFSNDPSLSPFEIALITAWADGGAPKGIESANSDRPVAQKRDTTDKSSPDLQKLELPCGEQPLPPAVLVAIRPELERDGAMGVSVRLPGGGRQIVAWIRRYDPDFPATYWLRSPLPLPPGSVLITEPRQGCSITVTLKARR